LFNNIHALIVAPTKVDNARMNIHEPVVLLGGISPDNFMQRYWHKKPLLIRNAIADFESPLTRAELLSLAGHIDVESRLIIQTRSKPPGRAKALAANSSSSAGKLGWKFQHGPFPKSAVPPLSQDGWTVLLQGMDLHDERIHSLMNQFRFIPDARLDDVMVSFATNGGGVGPHYDSYDVFLLQAHGQRRWRIGRQKDMSLVPDVPLKILANFEPEDEFVLNPGDMLYLPPRYAHDGIAVGECMTYSIGFRAPQKGALAAELLQRLAEDAVDTLGDAMYRDITQSAVEQSGYLPDAMVKFAQDAVQDALKDPKALYRALGEYLTEPKAQVVFESDADANSANGAAWGQAIRLDRRTRLMYDEHHVYINGESYKAAGRDAQLMRLLANQKHLSAKDVARLSADASELLQDWQDAGWLHADE
jgi:50S ribosomal protein L16 3-hydroxylase